MAIDINKKEYYDFGKPEILDRTKNRLIQMSELGMSEVGYGQFGIKNVMSGLYIEKVWNYSDEDFIDYIDWVKEIKERKNEISK